MGRRRWRKWDGTRREYGLLVVEITCNCGNVFRLRAADPDYRDDYATCLRCDRQFRLVVKVETRTAPEEEERDG